MRQLVTTGIILTRTNYGEADRIITVLTADHGKLRLMAKGVRRLKSKMAGGIDLFTVSDLTFIPGKSEIGTLISSRMQRHYGGIIKDIDRVQLGYELIKRLNRVTEDHPEAEYFTLLQQAFTALDDASIDLSLIRLWFLAQLLRQGGHAPNLQIDTSAQKLDPAGKYDFEFESMSLVRRGQGSLKADHIKLLRLVFSQTAPKVLNQINDLDKLLKPLTPLLQTMLSYHIRV